MKCRLIQILVLSFIVIANLQEARAAEPQLGIETAESLRLLQEGRKALLEFRITKAEEQFKALSDRPDGKAAAAHHLAQAALMKGMMTEDSQDYDLFDQRIESLKKVLEELPTSPWVEYLRADADFQKTIALTLKGRKLSAALAVRSAFKGYTDVVSKNPEYYDAYKGLGLIHIMLGSLPRTYQKVLGLFGYSGSVQEGLRELKLAARHGVSNREESLLTLALIQTWLLRKPEEGFKSVELVAATVPNSPFVDYLGAVMLLRGNRGGEALDLLKKVESTMRSGNRFYIHYVDYYLAYAYFIHGQYPEAERYFRRYLARHEGPALRSLSYLGLGEAIEMQGKRDEAVKYYQQVKVTRDWDTDAAAARLAKKHIDNPIVGEERQLLLGRSASDAGDFRKVETILKPLLADEKASMVARVEAAFLLGRAYQAQEQWDAALDSYAFAIRHVGDPQAIWAPWSRYYTAQVFIERGEHQKARKTLEEVLALDQKFDYYQALEQAAKATLDDMNS